MPPPQFTFQNNQDPQNTSNKQMVVKHTPESKQKQTHQPKKKNKTKQTRSNQKPYQTTQLFLSTFLCWLHLTKPQTNTDTRKHSPTTADTAQAREREAEKARGEQKKRVKDPTKTLPQTHTQTRDTRNGPTKEKKMKRKRRTT
jgi:hypothetical protein